VTDLVRKLEALSVQIARIGTKDPLRPPTPLTAADAFTVRQAGAVICKLLTEIRTLRSSLAAYEREEKRRQGGM
jgi:hypothetical protein